MNQHVHEVIESITLFISKCNWGSVPDWLAAIGTISAVFYALFHDRKKSKLDVGYFFNVKYTDCNFSNVYKYPEKIIAKVKYMKLH